MARLNQIAGEAMCSHPVPCASGPVAESLSRRNFLQATAAVAGAAGAVAATVTAAADPAPATVAAPTAAATAAGASRSRRPSSTSIPTTMHSIVLAIDQLSRGTSAVTGVGSATKDPRAPW